MIVLISYSLLVLSALKVRPLSILLFGHTLLAIQFDLVMLQQIANVVDLVHDR